MDFTIKTYRLLLNTLKDKDFSFQTFQDFLDRPTQPLYPLKGKDRTSSLMNESLPFRESKGAGKEQNKTIILRHDVDKLPENSLHFAQIQYRLGIKGSYYFRIVPESFKPEIIEKIADLGHEIGYHYETFDEAVKSFKQQIPNFKFQEKDLAEKGIELFEKNLTELRRYYPVKTICMHGSPLSKYDNKILWKYYNYKDFGILGEPYFDIDFSKVLYLTDTGRRWNGEKVSIRDKINAKDSPLGDRGASTGSFKSFKSTFDIITTAEKKELPNQIMFTFHPQRWTNRPISWTKELVLQNTKNVVKYFLNKIRS